MKATWTEAGDGPSPAHVLSKTTAHLLATSSPLHAHLRKLRVQDDESEDEKKTKETGTIAHAILLGRATKRIVVLDFPNYKTKAAQTARDETRAKGAIPVLANKEPFYTAQVQKIRRRLETKGIVLDGESERGIRWYERADDGTEVECWGALDHWIAARGLILDVKFGRSAHPEAARRDLYRYGADIQAAAYLSAVSQVHRELAGRLRFVFAYCELFSGAATPLEFNGEFQRLGELRWRRAVNTWARCLREDYWPDYSDGIVTIGPDPWMMQAEEAAQATANEQNFTTHPASTEAGESDDDNEDEYGEYADVF